MLRSKNQLFLLFFFVLFQVKSQNLVPNPSFENTNFTPCSWMMPPASNFSDTMQDWILPTGGTTDIYSTLAPITCFANCFSTYISLGHQAPRTGEVMCGFVTAILSLMGYTILQ
ncbi:hypothetical protein [Cytophaga aurantiaca]|uniref:hypothetical protein n=1 Tax=Cytophaga aurantiaca TaxID=29530 RepID=UPI0003799F5A|nr:hypothetical protein [Cytophaga aurantiaca]